MTPTAAATGSALRLLESETQCSRASTCARSHDRTWRSSCEETGETATLSAPGEHEAVTVDFVQSAASVQCVARLGRPERPHATAVGKVYLAYGGQLPEGRSSAFTDRTITDRGALPREVAAVEGAGLRAGPGEREDDLNAIAAPIRGSHGELVASSVFRALRPVQGAGDAAGGRAAASHMQPRSRLSSATHRCQPGPDSTDRCLAPLLQQG